MKGCKKVLKKDISLCSVDSLKEHREYSVLPLILCYLMTSLNSIVAKCCIPWFKFFNFFLHTKTAASHVV